MSPLAGPILFLLPFYGDENVMTAAVCVRLLERCPRLGGNMIGALKMAIITFHCRPWGGRQALSMSWVHGLWCNSGFWDKEGIS